MDERNATIGEHDLFAGWISTSSGLMLPTHPSKTPAEAPTEIQWHATSSGLLLPVAATHRRKPTCVSVFTGAGGFDLGFRSAGIRIVAACDYDTAACWTYCYNLGSRPIQMHFIIPQDRERFLNDVVRRSQMKPKGGEHWELVELDEHDRAYFHRSDGVAEKIEDPTPHYFLGDVRKLTGTMVLEAVGMQKGELDFIMGGPPCQGFSSLGKREVMDPRNSLVFDFARLILEISSKIFVFENVPGITSMVTPEGIPVIDAFCHMLADGGYGRYEALKKGLEYNLQAWGVIHDQGASSATLNTRDHHSLIPGEDEGETPRQIGLW